MANVIKIKRSSATAAPTTLNDGELAFSFLSGKLFIGNTTAVIPIGGTHSPGTLTANQALVANSTSGIDKVIVANLNIQELRANNSAGTAGFILASAGVGANAYWIDPSTLTTAAAGSNTQIQFNNSGAFGADANFTFDTATDVLTVGNSTVNAAINSTSIVLASGPKANTTGVYPASNTVGAELGDADQRFIINANTINASGLITGTAGLALTGAANVDNLTVTGFANVSGNVYVGNSTVFWSANSTEIDVGTTTINTTTIALGTNVTVNTTALFIGNSTVNTTIIAGNVAVRGSEISVGNSTVITTLGGDTISVGNSTVNTFINSTSIAIATGVTSNTSGSYPTSNTVATALGSTTQRWVLIANTINASGLITGTAGADITGTVNASAAMNVGANVNLTTSSVGVGNTTVNTVVTSTAVTIASGPVANTTGVYPASNTVATALGAADRRWVLIANTGTFAGAVSGITTLAAGNTTITGWVNATVSVNSAIITTGSVSANALGIYPNSNTVGVELGDADQRWNLSSNTINASGLITGTSGLTITGTANASVAMNVGANVNLTTSSVGVGNTTVNSVLTSTALTIASGIIANTLGVYPSSNTVGTALGSTSQRWVVIANTVNTSGNVGVGGDLTVSGNLTVSGTLTTIDTVNLTIKDPLIKLANNNLSDAVDLGFYGVYTDGTTQFAAFFRDASDSDKFKLYNGLTNEPGTTVDLTGGTLATLVLGTLEATNITLTNPLTVPNGGTGAGTFTLKGVIYGNGTSALQVTAAGTDGQVLQANSTGFPVFADLDGGTF